MDIVNKTQKPVAVPLPGGKKLRLGPGKTGQITPKAAEHAPLKKLIEEGVPNRIAHYQGIAESLRNGLSSLELAFLVPREQMSNTMTSVMLPEGVSYADLHRPLKEQGYVIYKSQSHLAETTFRLGTVGLITQDDIRGFLQSLKEVLP